MTCVDPPAINYLHPGAIANHRPARMARYYAATNSLAGAVAIVATFSEDGSWKAWIGATIPHFSYPEAAHQVAAWGVKLTETDARHFFPDVVGEYDP